jgi:carbon-monoxide dehydrogenase medium subunit
VVGGGAALGDTDRPHRRGAAVGGRRVPQDEGVGDGRAAGPALDHDELLVRVVLPAPLDHAGSAYASLEQPASGYALVGVAAVVVMGPDDRIAWAGVGVTGVHEHPYRAPEVEAGLVGSDGSAGAIAAAVTHVTDDVEVNSDIHAGSEYRAAMARVYARRAIEAALARART